MSTQHGHRSWRSGLAFVALAAGLVSLSASGVQGNAAEAASGVSAPSPQGGVIGGPTTFKRLSEGQYRSSIADLFGADVKIPGRFDPPLRDHGLLAVGAGKATVSTDGFEQFELRAREIAAQVMAPERRAKALSCTPSGPAFDRACAAAFLSKYGRSLYRRPLTDAELTSVLAVASATAAKSSDFHKGLEAGLSRLLASPNFIFRVERSERDPTRAGGSRLDSYSLAGRISFLLWDSSPDVELLDAAASGALQTEAGLQRQVDRLIDSPHFIDGVRAFFSDMFTFDGFNGLTKDQRIYPRYTSMLANDAREQTLKTLIDLLVTRKGDYRDIFTTKKTFMNRNMAALYGVPADADNLNAWTTYEFGPEEPRAGILTLAAFLMLDPTHEGRSSPTIRGKTVQENFLCEEVPIPPNNVDFGLLNNATKENPTARLRLARHSENPVCAGCHRITDPIGLSMENFDGLGAFRTMENGALIDASGELEGKTYKNAVDVGKILRDSENATSCVVQRAYEYGVGREATETEAKWLETASKQFATDGYVFPTLLRRIALSKPFRTVVTVQTISAR